MALSPKTLKVLKDAGLDQADVALFSDEDLLGLPGVGPAVLADIRATYPAQVAPAVLRPAPADVLAGPSAIEDLTAAAMRVGVVKPAPEPAAPTPPEPPAAAVVTTPGCTCAQPFRVTRTRQRAGRIERFCDACGAVAGATQTSGR